MLFFKWNLGFFLSPSTHIHRRRASQHARRATSGECREPATPSPLKPSELFPWRASIGSWQACAETSLRLLQVVQQSATRESSSPSAPRASRPARWSLSVCSDGAGQSKHWWSDVLAAERQVVRTAVLLQTRTLRYLAIEPIPSRARSSRSRCARGVLNPMHRVLPVRDAHPELDAMDVPCRACRGVGRQKPRRMRSIPGPHSPASTGRR